MNLETTPGKKTSTYLFIGLALVTSSTLMLEVLDTRLLSVLAWYHLTFFAISVAMLGMAAGAVLVFAGGTWWSTERVTRWLPALGGAFAVTLAVSHLANLAIPFQFATFPLAQPVLSISIATLALTCPFVLSGVVVTLVLTRTRGPIGILYGADLLGAAAGCLLIIGLLEMTDITSVALATAGAAAVGAWCFARRRGAPGFGLAVLALVLFGAAGLNTREGHPIGVMYPKNRGLWLAQDNLDVAVWNSHSYIVVRKPRTSVPYLWGGGPNPPQTPVEIAWAAIDGDAGTPFTKWDGRVESLDWIPYDVTSLPYQIRHGRAGVIGVGGGRDVLSAIWAGSVSVAGIEINKSFVNALNGLYRTFTNIADHPGVRIVNDEARSYLSRSGDHFDTLQMSLIDTWAATGAGAFTLSENGLYTREGWRVFLRALAPTGVLSVSRWYEPNAFSETTRLLSLGVASLIDLGVAAPAQHLVLATCGHISTLLISPSPFTAADGVALQAAADKYGFTLRLSPWHEAADESFRRIAHATTIPALFEAAANPDLDFTPPSDARPFFFNMLRPGAFWHPKGLPVGGISMGNLLATSTLFVLLAVVVVLIVVIVGWPLAMMGRPAMARGTFGAALVYFASIGVGFMCIQIPLLQRFSVYLGHPTYTFSIVLFTMILAAGVGSVWSDRIDAHNGRVIRALPFAIAALVLLDAVLMPVIMDATLAFGLPGRTTVAIAFVAPLACAIGCCFPIGMRLVRGHSESVTAWMWGVNGAAGVLASIVAVMISMWWGIGANLIVAAVLYASLAWPLRRLSVRAWDQERPRG